MRFLTHSSYLIHFPHISWRLMCVCVCFVGERGRRRQFTEAQRERQRLRLLGLWEERLSLSTKTHSRQLPRQVGDICQHIRTTNTWTNTPGVFQMTDENLKAAVDIFRFQTLNSNITTDFTNVEPHMWLCSEMFFICFAWFWQSGLLRLPLTAQPFSWCGESRQQWR